MKMANVVLEFNASAGDSEPQNRPVLIVGQQNNLQQVNWSQIKGKLQPAVSKEVKPPSVCRSDKIGAVANLSLLMSEQTVGPQTVKSQSRLFPVIDDIRSIGILISHFVVNECTNWRLNWVIRLLPMLPLSLT